MTEAMSPEEMTTAQNAYQRVRTYEAKKRRRYWGYFGAFFWTLNTCLLAFIKPSFIGFLFPAMWMLFLCFFIYSSVNEGMAYRRDTHLLEGLKGTFEPDINFDSKKDDSVERDTETSRPIFTLQGLIGFSIFMGSIFAIEYFIHHVLPFILKYYMK